jgi:SAM-dependent methyltransferase
VAPGAARYDGHADWYDRMFGVFAEDAATLTDLLAPGGGRLCLDVGCGTGRYAALLAKLGYRPLGVDISADQLRIARQRVHQLARTDAGALPVRSASVDAAVALYVHTDVEDFGAVVAEVARTLRPGGRLVCLGLHPCFLGAFVDRSTEDADGALQFVAGYGAGGWSWRSTRLRDGLWRRVGGHHKTLAAFLGAFTEAGLVIEELRELAGGGSVLPRNIAVAARR